MSPFRASAAITGEWRHFDFTIADRVATITFDRPDRLNALTFEVYADLRDLLDELPHRDDVEVIVITGRGKGFCSGGDVEAIIGELLQMDARDLLEFTRMTGAVVKNMRECPIPIVASVNGTAAGAGAVIALAADFRILAEHTRFHFLFTKVGLSGGDMGAAYLLPRLVGTGRATEILMFGDPVDAPRALEIGLATQVVEAGELVDATAALASRIATGPTFAYRATKILITREADMGLSASIDLEAMTQALLMTTRDHREFHAAFTDGRSPEWTGR